MTPQNLFNQVYLWLLRPNALRCCKDGIPIYIDGNNRCPGGLFLHPPVDVCDGLPVNDKANIEIFNELVGEENIDLLSELQTIHDDFCDDRREQLKILAIHFGLEIPKAD